MENLGFLSFYKVKWSGLLLQYLMTLGSSRCSCATNNIFKLVKTTFPMPRPAPYHSPDLDLKSKRPQTLSFSEDNFFNLCLVIYLILTGFGRVMHCIACFIESKEMLRFDGIIPNSKSRQNKIVWCSSLFFDVCDRNFLRENSSLGEYKESEER